MGTKKEQRKTSLAAIEHMEYWPHRIVKYCNFFSNKSNSSKKIPTDPCDNTADTPKYERSSFINKLVEGLGYVHGVCWSFLSNPWKHSLCMLYKSNRQKQRSFVQTVKLGTSWVSGLCTFEFLRSMVFSTWRARGSVCWFPRGFIKRGWIFSHAKRMF